MEEYTLIKLDSNAYGQYVGEPYGGHYLIDTGNITKKIICSGTMYQYHTLSTSTYSDHKELLQTAKKVYVHPSCKLSRTSVATKYKKCLDPWMADVVVMPDFDKYIDCEAYTMLFINEEEKLIINYQAETDKEFDSLQEDGLLEKLLSPNTLNSSSEYMKNYFGGHTRFTIDSVRNSKMFYKGNLFFINYKHEFILDAIMHIIPNDRIVFEDTIMESLGTEETKLDADNLVSIKEMLQSSDSNTKAAALKSLSVMDYMHYPESVKYVIKMAGMNNICYNNARNSTSVKFMLDYLFDSHSLSDIRRSSYSAMISENDYKLFRQLVQRIENCNDDSAVNSRIRFMQFMAIDDNGVLRPRLKVA